MPIDRQYASDQLRYYVASGFWTPKEIIRVLIEDCFLPADVTDADADWIAEQVANAVLAQRAAEKTWPAVTDWDRLDMAFSALDGASIIALHYTGMTASNGIDDISEVYHGRGGPQSPVIGYCFYHHQDVEQAIDGHGLMLAFGDIAGDKVKGVAVGRRIVAELAAAGLQATWNGTIDERICVVDMQWRKRNGGG